MKLWLNHPRSKSPDAMLTISIWAMVAVLIKFMLNGVSFTAFGQPINFGTVDSSLISALLLPTLSAYTARKWKSPPEPEKMSETQKIVETKEVYNNDNQN